ncbi:MAG: GNAT family N-acetyltransferase [Elainellaceae cyanobacterium]
MNLRDYQDSDFEPVIQLWWESWHSSSGYQHHRPIDDWKQRWRDIEAGHEVVVVVHHGEITAFAALNLQTCVLSQLFVSPRWKRKGIGRRLLQWATAKCPTGFSLKTAADNHESRAFYSAMGMVEGDGQRPALKGDRSINDFNGREEVEYFSKSREL